MFPSLYHGNECIKTYNFKMILFKSVYHIIFASVLQISGTYQNGYSNSQDNIVAQHYK